MFPLVDFMEISTPPLFIEASIFLPKMELSPSFCCSWISKSVYTFPLMVLRERLAGVLEGRLTSTAPLVEYREVGDPCFTESNSTTRSPLRVLAVTGPLTPEILTFPLSWESTSISPPRPSISISPFQLIFAWRFIDFGRRISADWDFLRLCTKRVLPSWTTENPTWVLSVPPSPTNFSPLARSGISMGAPALINSSLEAWVLTVKSELDLIFTHWIPLRDLV